MAHEVGVAIDVTGGAPGADVVALAQHAEQQGLDLVVVTDDAGPPGLDPWSTAAWIAGRTHRIALAVGPSVAPAEEVEPPVDLPRVAAKGRETLDRLAGPRLVSGRDVVVAPSDVDVDRLRDLAARGTPAVAVHSTADVDRVAALAAELRADHEEVPTRSLAARSRRRPGIDYDGVPASLRDTAVEPGDPAYPSVSSTYLRGGAPGLVLRPTTPAEVADALAFARRHRHLPLGIRSGGHGISGRSTNDGGLVIDVGALDTIEVLDEDRRLVRVGPGATWKQVAAALEPHGWAIGSGDYGGVGVGGLATAGGIGYLSRQHGLTIDHVRAVELVLADGRQVRADPSEHPDLFWAVRGAGASFGIATAFEMEADEVDEVGYAQLSLVTDDIEDALRRYGKLAQEAPRDTTVFLVTGPSRRGRSGITLYAVVDSDDPEVIVDRLTPFAEIGPLTGQQVVLTPYAGIMGLAPDVGADGHQGGGEPVSRSGFLPDLTDAFARDAAALLRSGQVFFFQLRSMGGAVGDTPSDAMAFSHRDAAFQVTAMGADQAALDDAWDALGHHVEGLYLSFDTDRRPERLHDAFPGPVLERLRRLKGTYDPDRIFRDNFAIEPQEATP